MKCFEGAWSGLVLQAANGSYMPDNGAATFDQMRRPGRFNSDLSLRRTFQIRERFMLEFAANVTNLLNRTQFEAN